MKQMPEKERILVIGGGFAGLGFIKHIDKKRFDVTLVDRNNFHSFPPLFYQIASSGIEPGSICFPFRREIRKGKAKGIDFRLGEVKSINYEERTITTQYETIGFDKLVIAAGSTNNFFGNQELIKYVYTLKSTAQAMRMRDEILDRLERASIARTSDERRRLLSFVVIGGGPAGVEIAGALGELKRFIVPREYPSISQDEVNIVLLEGSGSLLGAMSEKSQEEALKYLGRLMVDVRLNSLMEAYSENIVTLSDGAEIYSGMVIWTAGVSGQPIEMEKAGDIMGHGYRVKVDQYNRVEGQRDVFAIGDMSLMVTSGYPKGHPQLAQVAIQQGRHLAMQLNSGRFDHPFVYKDKGTMATVGRDMAVADIGKVHFSGFVAWLVWMFIHLLSILGMRNKISVLIDWIWAYFSYGTSLRLLLHSSRWPLRSRWGER
ncbi:MAG: NAD(P)/FAD-dependent oxidoreductase [Paramuribaculum sp.]|nr:NAD(P)/FAD-dependent oxidoreductase [Paramuribaculum sp.]